jgi:hypothetical protein
MALFSGIAEGGPYHGKPLHHGTTVLKVARAKIGGKVVTWFGPPTEAIRIDEYRHKNGRWIWKEK